LIEFSLVLILMGITLSAGYSFLHSYLRFRQNRQTQQHQDLVLKALQQHFTQYLCLPYPADPKKEDGQEQAFSSQVLLVGLVPYRKLGLPRHVAKDGYHRWMTYSLDEAMAMTLRSSKHIRSVFCKYLYEKGTLDISDGETTSVNALLGSSDSPALVLISHGPKGYGAFTQGGKRIPLSPNCGKCKQKNSAAGSAGSSIPFCYAPEPSDQGLNDDCVRWVTKGHLIQGANIQCFDVLCPPDSAVDLFQK